MKKTVLLLAMIACAFGAAAQKYLPQNEFFYNLPNRLNFFVIENPSAREVEMGISFHAGAFLEGNIYSGMSVLFEKAFAARLKDNLRARIREYAADSALLTIQSSTSYEFVQVNLTLPENTLERALKAVHDALIEPFSDSLLQVAALRSNAQLEDMLSDVESGFFDEVSRRLWEENYGRRSTMRPWNDSTIRLLPPMMVKMREMYFCPQNTMLIFNSALNHDKIYRLMKDNFIEIGKCNFNQFTRFPAPNYKLRLGSAQMVKATDAAALPFFLIAMQGPNMFEDRRGNYCAAVMADLMARPGNPVRIFLEDTCGLSSARLQCDLTQYLSQLTLTVFPDTADLAGSYACLRHTLTLLADTAWLSEADFSSAKESVIAKFRNVKSSPLAHVQLLNAFWTGADLNTYATYTDSIHALTLKDFRAFVHKYFHARHHVAGLAVSPQLRTHSKVDSSFTNTGDRAREYLFTFLENTARFASQTDDSVFNSLAQFLKINPGLKIKVNGVCHKDELLQVSDKAMSNWIKSLDEFIMNPPSMTNKKKLRLDVYRSLTVIKRLVEEGGISVSRLFGTGQLRRTGENDASQRIVYCSETLN